jgi:hypothetical protein
MNDFYIPEGPLSHDDHLELLKQAIASSLDARLKHEARLREENKDKPQHCKIFSVRDLIRADANWLYLDEVIENPIRKALRRQLQQLGKRLFDLVGTTADILEIAEEIANPRNYYSCFNIMDKNWDGIGSDTDAWVA